MEALGTAMVLEALVVVMALEALEDTVATVAMGLDTATAWVMALAIMAFGRDPQTKNLAGIAGLLSPSSVDMVGLGITVALDIMEALGITEALGIMALVGLVDLDTHPSTVVTTIFHTLDMDTEGRRALEASF